jgi:Predicted Zn peptidase
MSKHVNPNMIRWARLRSGLSVNDIATMMKRDPSEIAMWEEGTKKPSYSQLEKLAYSHLHIPLALFFFPIPPNLPDHKQKFRRLSEYELERLGPDTIQKIHLGQAYQLSLKELAVEGRQSKKIFVDVQSTGLNTRTLARKARTYLGITHPQQVAFQSPEKALKQWRFAIEQAGIYTFKDTFKDDFVSGFCLLDQNWPIIFVNNSSAFTRQIFTLAHELGHILHGVNGVTDIDEDYLEYMAVQDKKIEMNCNLFASELLMPENQFKNDLEHFKINGTSAIAQIADKYSVSREVVLRRLLDHGAITQDNYREQTKEWNADYFRNRRSKAGGNYYLTKLAYLGEGYTQLAYQNYNKGRIDGFQLANHLNIKAKNLKRLSTYLR